VESVDVKTFSRFYIFLLKRFLIFLIYNETETKNSTCNYIQLNVSLMFIRTMYEKIPVHIFINYVYRLKLTCSILFRQRLWRYVTM